MSIDDYMPQSEIGKLLQGGDCNMSVPIDPGDWDGVCRKEQAEMIQGLEDSILLGVALQHEAQALRAQPATVRENEGRPRPLRVVMSSVPDLPLGTMVVDSSGDLNR